MTQLQPYGQVDIDSLSHIDLRKHAHYLQNELRILNERFKEVVSDLFWHKGIISNKHLTSGQKLVLIATREVVQGKEADSEGYTRVYRDAIADVSGLSSQSVSSSLKDLSEKGVINKKVQASRDKLTNQVKKDLYVKIPKTTLEQPERIEFEEKEDDKKWGGRRVTCPSCHSTHVREIHYYVCEDCGSTLQPEELVKVDESRLYPEHHIWEMENSGIIAPQRGCYRCNSLNWLPALKDEQWLFLCGTCYPFLLESAGQDLRQA